MDELCKLLAEKLDLAYDYVASNAPEVIQRYTEYNITISTILLILSVVAAILGIAGLVWLIVTYFMGKDTILWHVYNGDVDDFTGMGVLIAILTTIFIVAGVIGIIFSSQDLLAWIKIPEIQILKELGMLT